jgi:hypothetical protein
MENPLRLIVAGIVLLLCGAVLPFLMVIGVLPKTLPLSFLAVACSVAGLLTGFMGIAGYRRRQK